MRLAALIALAAALLPPQDKPAWEKIVERGRKNVERLRELRSMLPRAEFDVPALARALEGDAARALDFVGSRIVHEPYRGFMKGARGALDSRRANAADRALLLAALLADKEPKLVRGSLPAARQPAPGRPPEKAAPADPKALEAVAARFGADPEKLRRKEAETRAAEEAFQAALRTRVERDRTALAAALDAARIPPPEAVAPVVEETWWVRLGDKDLGRPEGAEEVAVHAPGELPADAFHRFTLRMVITRNAEEIPVLDVTFRSADLYGRTLTVGNAAADDPARLGKVKGGKPKPHFDALAATARFIPLVTGGEQPVTGHPFDLTGNRLPVRDGVIHKLQGALDLFEALPGGDAEKKELTACRLDVVQQSPGAEPAEARRVLWKKGGSARQRAFDLLARREILVLPGGLTAELALDVLLDADIAAKEAVLGSLKKPALASIQHPPVPDARLYRFAVLRTAALRPVAGLWSPRPTLVSFVHRVIDGAPVSGRAGFDILFNPVAGPKAASWKESATLGAGILDTALEHEAHRAKGAHANASLQLERALAAKQALTVEAAGDVVRIRIPGTPRGWYDVRAAGGCCLGYMEEGGGQDMAEYATLLADKLEEIREWQSYAERLDGALACAMNAMDSNDAETAFAHCMAMLAIGEAFGWAAGGILGGAAGDSPWARLGAMAAEDWLNDTLGDATDAATGGR